MGDDGLSAPGTGGSVASTLLINDLTTELEIPDDG